MLSLFKAILLCALCSLAAAKYFNWKAFGPIEGTEETKIIWNVKLETLYLNNGRSVNYLYGTCTIDEELKQSVKVYYSLERGFQSTGKSISACDHSFHDEYLKPYGKNANFTTGNECPVPPHTIAFEKVNSLEDLTAPSKLSPGTYYVEVQVVDQRLSLGGFRGHFECLD